MRRAVPPVPAPPRASPSARLRRLLEAVDAAGPGDVQEHLLQRPPPIAGDQLGGSAAIDDRAGLIIRTRSQSRSTSPILWEASRIAGRLAPYSARDSPGPSRRYRDRARRSARRAAAPRACSAAPSRAPAASSARPTGCRCGGREGPRAAGRRPARRCARRPGRGRRDGRRPEILAHRQPMRQIDIGRGEVHPVQHPVAVAEHVQPSTRTDPAVGRSRPSSIEMVVVLPAPLPPRSPTVSPRITEKLTASTAATVPNRLVSP